MSVCRCSYMFLCRWEKKTGNPWNTNMTAENLVELMVKKSTLQPELKCLDGMVTLIKME